MRAPHLKKTSTLLADNPPPRTSCHVQSINCVLAVKVGMSHVVLVVSTLDELNLALRCSAGKRSGLLRRSGV